MLHRYKAILFDLDGTLVCTKHLWERFIPEAVLEFGYGDEKTVELLIKAEEEGKDPIRTVFPDLPLEEVERIYKVARKKVLDHVDEIEPRFTREELLTILDGKATAIVTQTKSHFARKVLKAVGFYDLFDVIVGSDRFKNPKPHPEPILMAIDILGEPQSVYVGDTLSDEEAAHLAGIDFVHVEAVRKHVQGYHL